MIGSAVPGGSANSIYNPVVLFFSVFDLLRLDNDHLRFRPGVERKAARFEPVRS